jgi:DNA repair exonuclease SbcCD nuclease subunit
MRFIHTADWQIGKVFRKFREKEPVLQQARLDAIETLGGLAQSEGVDNILVAGDLYDNDAPSQKTLLEPLERMRRSSHVQWRIIPGNHDPHRAQGLWDRARASGLPNNVQLLLSSEPVDLAGATLLPAPLLRKSDVRDLTEWMDTAPSPSGALRIGLAHGSVVGFQSEGEANNPIDPTRPNKAGLDYLALGDWHRTVSISQKVWYAGTPEPDRFGSQQAGKALIVDIAGPGAPPRVSEHVIGRFNWHSREERLDEAQQLPDLEQRLRASCDISSTIMRLSLIGALPLSCHSDLDSRLLSLSAAMFWLDVDRSRLKTRPTAADLERIDFDGVLRGAAEVLRGMSEDDAMDLASRKRADDALIELFLLANAQNEARS